MTTTLAELDLKRYCWARKAVFPRSSPANDPSAKSRPKSWPGFSTWVWNYSSKITGRAAMDPS